MTGIVFAKFTKPAHRGKTIVFSDQAMVTMRNGAFYLLCRVGDLRPTHLIESHISAYMMRSSRSGVGLSVTRTEGPLNLPQVILPNLSSFQVF